MQIFLEVISCQAVRCGFMVTQPLHNSVTKGAMGHPSNLIMASLSSSGVCTKAHGHFFCMQEFGPMREFGSVIISGCKSGGHLKLADLRKHCILQGPLHWSGMHMLPPYKSGGLEWSLQIWLSRTAVSLCRQPCFPCYNSC